MHPHAHLIAMTVVLDGEFEDEDSIGGKGPHNHTNGGLYMAQAGTGLTHMEQTATEGSHSVLQIIVKMRLDAWNDPPGVCRVTPAEVPAVKVGDAEVKVLVGTFCGQTSPATVSGLPAILLLRVNLPAGAGVVLPIDALHERGFLFLRSGVAVLQSTTEAGDVASVEVRAQESIALFGAGSALDIQSGDPSTPIEFVSGARVCVSGDCARSCNRTAIETARFVPAQLM
jgi:redox-sensitive bicupin YhaK (pirin superfamily)